MSIKPTFCKSPSAPRIEVEERGNRGEERKRGKIVEMHSMAGRPRRRPLSRQWRLCVARVVEKKERTKIQTRRERAPSRRVSPRSYRKWKGYGQTTAGVPRAHQPANTAKPTLQSKHPITRPLPRRLYLIFLSNDLRLLILNLVLDAVAHRYHQLCRHPTTIMITAPPNLPTYLYLRPILHAYLASPDRSFALKHLLFIVILTSLARLAVPPPLLVHRIGAYAAPEWRY